MANVTEIVTRALRKIGVVASDEPITADDLKNGVDALNSMIHGFRLDGVDFEWVDQEANETFALDSEYHEGIVYILASRLSPDFETPANFNADDWMRSIQANMITAPTATVPAALNNLTARRRRGTTHSGGV